MSLDMAALEPQQQALLSKDWKSRVDSAESRYRADRLYCGRGFNEAVSAGTKRDCSIFVVSAGLGLIDSKTLIPSYSATVTTNAPSSVTRKVTDTFDPHLWWSALSKTRFSIGPLHRLIAGNPDTLFVLALSNAYLTLISEDLHLLSANNLKRVRIVGPSTSTAMRDELATCRVPYDDRFDGPDGPLRGTRSDFPQRTARHLIEWYSQNGGTRGLDADKRAIANFMDSLTPPPKIERQKLNDQEMLREIKQSWDEFNGNVGRLLRHFRDEKLIACEQSRFGKLCRQIRQEGIVQS